MDVNGSDRNGAAPDARRPIGVDLFAGAGGLSLGFEQAGFDVVASVEYDPIHAATHAFNFPRTTVLCANVCQVSADRLRDAVITGRKAHGHRQEWSGEVDVIFGGPPCQGFSAIGKRLIDDERNQLVFHFFRLVSQTRPRYFVMENVPGMTRGGHAGILAQLISEFEQDGYRVREPVETLNAADFGVPQDRSRLFLLGAREDQPIPAYPEATVRPVSKRPSDQSARLFDEDGGPKGPTVWDAISDLPDLDDFAALRKSDAVELSVDKLEAMDRNASAYARRLRRTDLDSADLSHPRTWDRKHLTSSMRTRHTSVSIERFRETAPGETEPISRFYRPHPLGLCNTLRSGTGSERGAYTSPRPIHPTLPRVISVREAARLHSFPDWFRFHSTKWHGFRQIGNAVAPLVGRSVGTEIVKALDAAPSKPSAEVPLGAPRLLRLTMVSATAEMRADPDSVPPPRKRDFSPAPA